MQLCATVSRFKQLEDLNKGEKIDGLVLIVSIAFDATIKISIKMPSSFSVSLESYQEITEG